MRRIVWLPVLGCTLLAACAPPADQGGFDSDNPASKLYAIRRAGEARDASTLPQLVEQLESDDPAVRLMAITALERIEGTRLGYNPYAAAADRQQAVQRWVDLVQSRAATVSRMTPSGQ